MSREKEFFRMMTEWKRAEPAASRRSNSRKRGPLRGIPGLDSLGRVILGLVLACSLLLGPVSTARADEYNPKTAGHPLRMLAYALHPVGVVIDYLLMRPAHWIVSQEPFETLFGHED
jgi:hypothetical protein